MAQLTDERLAELRNRFERAGEPYYYSPLTHLECREVFAEVDRLRADKAGAYAERDRLVAVLSKVFRSHLCRHPDEDTEWDNDWRWIVCIHTPAGQATWHVHDSERHQFDHLPVRPNHWDGHTTEEKYRRLESIPLPEPPEFEAEVTRLRARNAELVKVLRSVEWEPIYFTDEATIEDEPEICTRCHRRRTDGHAPDCELAAALNSN